MKTDFMKDCKMVKLGDVCEIIMGQSPNSQNYNNENIGLPLIQGNADIYRNHLSPHMFTSIITKTCEINDIIMSVRAPVGAVVIADIKACIGRGVCAIRAFENQKYIYQYLLYFENKWRNISQGSTFESVNSNQIYNLSIPLPSLEIQQKIADILSTQDKVIELKQKLIDQKKQQKKWLMQKLLDKCYKKYPLYEIIKIADYVDYRGKTPEKVDNGILLITAKNVKMGFIDYECSKEYVKISDYKTIMHRGSPKYGDVLITTEAPCGNVAQINNENIALAQRIIKYRAKKNYSNNFLCFILQSETFQSKLKIMSTGGTVQGIKGSLLHKMKIPCPPLEEQTAIAEILSAQDKEIELLEKQLIQEKLKKKALMQLLLTVK